MTLEFWFSWEQILVRIARDSENPGRLSFEATNCGGRPGCYSGTMRLDGTSFVGGCKYLSKSFCETSSHTAQGLCDMAGNVVELVAESIRNERPWKDDDSFLQYGGSWRQGPNAARSWMGTLASTVPDDTGFRCAASIPPRRP